MFDDELKKVGTLYDPNKDDFLWVYMQRGKLVRVVPDSFLMATLKILFLPVSVTAFILIMLLGN